MKILEQGPKRLVVEENPIVLRMLCVVLAASLLTLGIAFRPIFSLISTDPAVRVTEASGWLLAQTLISVSAVIPLGVVLSVLKIRRYIFDSSTNLVTFERVGVLRSSVSEYPLSSLIGVGLGQSFSASGGRTTRAVLEFSDAHGVVPLKPYFQSGKRPAQMAEKINTWLLRGERSLEHLETDL